MSTKDGKPDKLPTPKKPVGYGSPPEATRFKKGVSGNPKGRPKGSLNVATVFTKTLREKVVINEHGERKIVTKLEAAFKQLVNKAASGDLRAFAQLVALAHHAEARQNIPGVQEPVLGDLDHEVIDGIMKRFLKEEEPQQPEVQEGTDGDDERG
jgi:hypothetical protein